MAINTHVHVETKEEIDMVNSDPNLEYVINVGMDYQSSKRAIEIAKSNEKFLAAAGIHPLHIEGEDPRKIEELLNSEKVQAVGEIGLDINGGDFKKQVRYAVVQIKLANKYGLPVIVHCDGYNKEMIELLEHVRPEHGCVFHCFKPELDKVKKIAENGWYISFAGRITYASAKLSLEVAKMIPYSLFLVETDSPFININGRRSNPSDVTYVISKIAEVKGVSYKDIEIITRENAKRLFMIK